MDATPRIGRGTPRSSHDERPSKRSPVLRPGNPVIPHDECCRNVPAPGTAGATSFSAWPPSPLRPLTVGGVQYARVSSQTPVVAHASKLAVGVGAAQAYQQAGSIFTEQVPQGAVVADQSALAVGGSVYAEQVPHGVVVAQSALAIGGSVYTEQVPAAATPSLPAYGASGSVYTEQVPSAR